MEEAEEIQNFFAGAVEEGADDLLDELEEMMAEDQMKEMDVGTGEIDVGERKKVPQKKEVQPVEATAEEEAELEAMMAL